MRHTALIRVLAAGATLGVLAGVAVPDDSSDRGIQFEVRLAQSAARAGGTSYLSLSAEAPEGHFVLGPTADVEGADALRVELDPPSGVDVLPTRFQAPTTIEGAGLPRSTRGYSEAIELVVPLRIDGARAPGPLELTGRVRLSVGSSAGVVSTRTVAFETTVRVVREDATVEPRHARWFGVAPAPDVRRTAHVVVSGVT